jgi:hypothetical protein
LILTETVTETLTETEISAETDTETENILSLLTTLGIPKEWSLSKSGFYLEVPKYENKAIDNNLSDQIKLFDDILISYGILDSSRLFDNDLI